MPSFCKEFCTNVILLHRLHKTYTCPAVIGRVYHKTYISRLLPFCCLGLVPTYMPLPIGTNGKPLAPIDKFRNAIGKLMIGKILATNGEEIINAMIGNDVLANYW